jgi:membrane protease subunit HflC
MAGNKTSRTSTMIVLGLIGLVVVLSSMFTVSERELAVVLEFGKPVKSIKAPGLYFKVPLIQEVRRLPKTRQFWSNAADDLLVDLPTRDGKKIEISVWAIWRITDPDKFVKVMRTVDNAEQQVRQRIRAGVRNVITSYDLSEVVRSTDREMTYSFGLEDLPEASAQDATEETVADLTKVGEQATIRVGREKIMDEIRQAIDDQLTAREGSDGETDRGIELVDVGISNIGFVQSVRLAAFERLKAFMDAIAARYQNEGEQRKQEIINETNAEVEKILGEGEEQSKRLRGEVEAEIIESYAKAIRATGDFYNFQRTLEVYEKSLDKDTRLILTTDSDLFRMLKEISRVGANQQAVPAE